MISVPTEDCIEYEGSKDGDGYGMFSIRGYQIRAHRYAYMQHYGDIPDGLIVMHKCDNPSCINPEHLILGTIADNNKDRDNKGHQTPMRGPSNGNAWLTERQIPLLIADMKKRDLTVVEICAKYKIGKSTAYRYWEKNNANSD